MDGFALFAGAAALALVTTAAAAEPPKVGDPARKMIYGAQVVLGEKGSQLNADYEKAVPAMLEVIRNAGVQHLRMGISWCGTEDERGTFDWTADDRPVKWLADHGMPEVACVATTPEWASAIPPEGIKIMRDKGQNNLVTVVPIDAQYWPDYERYLRAAIRRYGSIFQYYEIWNEPDGMAGPRAYYEGGKLVDVHFGGDPKWYTELLRHAYRIIKEEDPDAVVAAGALESHTKFLRDIYDAGAQPYFDAVSIHPYGDPLNLGWIQEIRQVMVEHGDAAKPIWVTEWAVNFQSRSPARQQQLVREGLRYLRETPWIGLAHFHLANMFWGKWDGAGHMPEKTTPMYDAFREMVQEAGPAKSYVADFEDGSLRDWWFWSDQEGAKQEISDALAHGGQRSLVGTAPGSAFTHLGMTYVKAADPVIEFWYYVDPAHDADQVTVKLEAYSADIERFQGREVTIAENVPHRTWARARVRLREAFPQIADDPLLKIGIATSSTGKGFTVAVDDVSVK
jgi:hypothetical protein